MKTEIKEIYDFLGATETNELMWGTGRNYTKDQRATLREKVGAIAAKKAKARRKDFIWDVAAKELYRLFIKPILRSRDFENWGDRIEKFFRPAERSVILYRALDDFDLIREAQPTDVYGRGMTITLTERQVRKGDQIFVRIDDKFPNVIEMEHIVGHREPITFVTNKKTWEGKYRVNLEEIC